MSDQEDTSAFETAVLFGVAASLIPATGVLGWMFKNKNLPAVQANGLLLPTVFLVGAALRIIALLPWNFTHCGPISILVNSSLVCLVSTVHTSLYETYTMFYRARLPWKYTAHSMAAAQLALLAAPFTDWWLNSAEISSLRKDEFICKSSPGVARVSGITLQVFWFLTLVVWLFATGQILVGRRLGRVPFRGLLFVVAWGFTMTVLASDENQYAKTSRVEVSVSCLALVAGWVLYYAAPCWYRKDKKYLSVYTYGLPTLPTSKELIAAAWTAWEDAKDIVIGFQTSPTRMFPLANAEFLMATLRRDALADYKARTVVTRAILDVFCSRDGITSLRTSVRERMLKQENIVSAHFFRAAQEEVLTHMYAEQVPALQRSQDRWYVADMASQYVHQVRSADRDILSFEQGPLTLDDFRLPQERVTRTPGAMREGNQPLSPWGRIMDFLCSDRVMKDQDLPMTMPRSHLNNKLNNKLNNNNRATRSNDGSNETPSPMLPESAGSSSSPSPDDGSPGSSVPLNGESSPVATPTPASLADPEDITLATMDKPVGAEGDDSATAEVEAGSQSGESDLPPATPRPPSLSPSAATSGSAPPRTPRTPRGTLPAEFQGCLRPEVMRNLVKPFSPNSHQFTVADAP